ncbi:MAG: hypothetical protein H0U59_04140 [Gemmatimonadaceae bacterium]|nr:hypothetical protein [Gemmatimonadaceae bacterium]
MTHSRLLWVACREAAQTAPRCVHCELRNTDHPQDKCLFEAKRFEPMTATDYFHWYNNQRYGLPPVDDEE